MPFIKFKKNKIWWLKPNGLFTLYLVFTFPCYRLGDRRPALSYILFQHKRSKTPTTVFDLSTSEIIPATMPCLDLEGI